VKEVKEIAVIGAGIGGLATSIRLAKKGHKVKIFERADFIGGKCRVVNRNGFKFDLGPTLLTIPAVYRDLFMKSGKRLEHVLKMNPVDPAFSYHFPDGKKVTFSNLSVKKNCDEIEEAFGKDAGDEWHRIMQRAERMWEISRTPFVESELKLKNLIREISLTNVFVLKPWLSLRKYVDKYTKDKYLKMIIDRYATYSGSDPRKAPAPLLTIPFIESAFGAWHITGGIGNLAIALGDRARELGVEIILNSEVTEIVLEKNSAMGVVVKGQGFLKFDEVVANADAKLVYNELIKSKPRKILLERRKLNKATPSFSGFTLLLGLDNSKVSGAMPKLNHHNIWFPSVYDDEFKSIFEAQRPVVDPTIYICAPSDSEMKPSDSHESWSVLINAPLQNISNGMDWRNEKEKYADQIIHKLDTLGLRVSERLVYKEIRTPFELQEDCAAPGGSIYGTSSNGALATFSRAKNRSPIKNLYLVGGSAHPGGGLPLVGLSSEIVAEIIG
jgi:phytoene desaturase